MKCLLSYANQFKSSHVLIPAGMDFAFQFAELSYTFLEETFQLLESVDSKVKLKFIYSTVDEYYQAIQRDKIKKGFYWPVYNGDFFPYNGNFNLHYWTGFYSSRPNFKSLIRRFSGET